MSMIARFIKQPGRRRELAIRSAVWLVLVRVGLRLMPYRRMSERLERRASRRAVSSIVPDRLTEDVAWAVNGLAAVIPGTTCLPKALVGQYLLRRYGCESRVRLGVAKHENGAFAAHAWLEHHDSVLIGGETMSDYSPMPAWPTDLR